MRSKKYRVLIIVCLIIMLGGFYFVYKKNKSLLSSDEALKLGEEKYLNFLWFVDGTFRDEEYEVNNRKLDADKHPFSCETNKENNKECIVKDFEEKFSLLFASSITYDKVYSDGISFSWSTKNGNDFSFDKSFNCAIKRMAVNHELEVGEITKNKITYYAKFNNSFSESQNQYTYEKLFVLVLEDGVWKINEAYYHDACKMDYNIR